MRVAIYGAGSLGTVLGAFIARNAPSSGLDLGSGIELYNRNASHVQALRKTGAVIDGEISFTQSVSAFLPSEMEGFFDYIFLMTKQLENDSVVRFLSEHLKADGAICTTQNGLPEPAIAEIIGEDRTLGCTIGWGATMKESGHSTLTSSKDRLCFEIGAISQGGKRHLPVVRSILELMGPVTVSENFIGSRWSKLLINASFSGMSTVIGDTFGAVCDNKKARRCAQAIMKECIEVSRASGVKIEPVQGKDISRLFDYNGRLKKAFSFMLIPLAMKSHRGITAGMLNDYRNGKKCEIDAINGSVCRQGDRVGVDTPFCDKVAELVHGFEKGEGEPSYENLNAFDSLL
ncbi:MAG: 2-dehydropantoate 2-reductase [Spirochaetales bacterium]|nr:2-dehydropantoate 2-reductase [Spirochaetales bacterium]